MFSNDPVMNKRMYTLATILVVVLIVFLGVKTLAVLKSGTSYVGGDPTYKNTITVTGLGEVVAVPDVASISFAVVEQAATVAEAQSKATEKINTTLASLKSLGIEERDIKTTDYNAYPRYEYFNQICTQFSCPPQGRQTIVGYEVRQGIMVKVRNIEQSGTILSTIGSAGVSDIGGLVFMVDDEEGKLREARKMAIKDAQEQAQELADDLDVKIVGIVSFNESGNYPRPFYAVKDMALGMGGSAEAPSLPTGENKMISNVVITYEIR